MQKLPGFMTDNYLTDKCEILIDYYFSWTIRCSQDIYRFTDSNVNKYSKLILSKCLFNDEKYLENKKVTIVKCGKNCKDIDLWFEIEIENEEKVYVMIIETKMYTSIRSGQLEKYKIFIDNYYKGKENKYTIKYRFLRIDEIKEEDLIECSKFNYLPISIMDIQNIIKNLGETKNILFDEFWFRWWENDTTLISSNINDIFGL